MRAWEIKRIVILLFGIAICSVSMQGCHCYDDKLKLINDSEKRIYVVFGIDTSKTELVKLQSPQPEIDYWKQLAAQFESEPDSIMRSKKFHEYVKLRCGSCIGHMEPGDSLNVAFPNLFWNLKVKEDGGLQIFFFNADTVEAYEWQTIINGKMYLERRLLSLEELEASNWTVSLTKH